MATEQTTKTVPSAKFETFVEQQLAQVRQRLRALDVGAGALLLLAITLGYAVVMAVFDLFIRGSNESWVTGVRLGAFGLYLAVLGAGVFLLIARLLRKINPYYCARQLEQTLPDAKNSVVNWLDLKEEHLPTAIRNSLGIKAAKDLKQADADKVVDPKQAWLLGGIAGVLFFVLLVIFAFSPGQFGSLLARAFAPFRDISLRNRATITLIRPTGDATVPANMRIEFLAQIDGRFPKVNHPQAPTLWYRYGPGDPFVPVALEEDPFGQWAAVLAADLVHNGFTYKMTAGDFATPEYQITLRVDPVATKFDVTYRYRRYRKLPDETVVFPNEHAVFPEIHGHRGTEITLVIHTNQPVREGRLQMEFGKTLKEVPGERLADDPKAFRCKFTLERSGQFRVLYKTQNEESNTDRTSAYPIDVLDDRPPAVVLTKPGQDVKLPANGTLTLEGYAHDDFGLKALALQVRVLEGAQKPNLAPLPYRPGKKFQFETGTYPAKIDYLEVLALDRLKTDKDLPFPLTAGMVLEYWLEATDNADYPSATGNVGRSQTYKINILEPQKDDKKRQDERQKAEDQQKKHEKQQDQQHKKENDKQKQDQADGDSGKSQEERKADNLKNEIGDTASKLKQELDRQEENKRKEEQQKQQGESKGDDPGKADNKPGEGQPPEAQPKDAKPGNDQQQAGDKKDDGGKGDGAKPAEAKNEGDQQPQPNQGEQQAGAPKGAGNEQKPQPTAKGQDGDGNQGNQPDQQPMNAKAGPKDDPKQQPSQGKDQGAQAGKEKPAQAKENGPKDQNPDMKQGAEAKGPDGKKDAPSPQAKNDKQEPKNQPAGKKGDNKPGGADQIGKEKGAGDTKPDAAASKNPPGADGSRKPADAKGDEAATRKSESKDGGGKGQDTTQEGPPTQSKNQPQNPKDQPQGNAKDTPAEQAKDSAMAKNDQGQGPPREPTAKDLDRLREQLKTGDPQAQQTVKELTNNLPEAKDPEMRKAAEELLKEAAKQAPQADVKQDSNMKPDSVGKGPDQRPKDQGAPMTAKDGGGNDPDPMPKKGNDPQKDNPGNDSPGAKNAGGSGPNSQGPQDKTNPSVANKEFADRAGNLQLEELKKHADPKTLKQAGISDEEWQQFLKNAQAYEELRARSQNQPKKEIDQRRGAASQLSGAGRRVVSQPGTTDPAALGQPMPPPELRQAQRLFTQPKQ